MSAGACLVTGAPAITALIVYGLVCFIVGMTLGRAGR